MRVADERSALITLAAQGIGAAPGEPFLVRDDVGHLRVTLSALTGGEHEVRAIGARLAEAAGSSAGRGRPGR